MGVEPEVAFGKVLRDLRKTRRLSQESLAHAAEIERNYVSLLERGKNSASIKIIFKLAAALETTVSDLMGRVEAKRKEKPGKPRPRK